MKAKPIIVASALLVIGGACLYAFQAPTVTISPAMPSTIYVNSTTTVTITAHITDSLVIPNGVNLVQTNPLTGSETVVGSLNANGQTFTIRFQPVTTAPILFSYQVSAAFRGLLQRSLSLPITVAVAPLGVVLPPDPGPAGLQILAGIDSDGDGVRDDEQRWIGITYHSSAKTRAALTQAAIALEHEVVGAASSYQPLSNAIDCMNFTLMTGPADVSGGANALKTYVALRTLVLNTPARANAFFQANSQFGSGVRVSTPYSQKAAKCTINPSQFPN
jgi:hypothetical protein